MVSFPVRCLLPRLPSRLPMLLVVERHQAVLQSRMPAGDDDRRTILIRLSQHAIDRRGAESQEEQTIQQLRFGQHDFGAIHICGAHNTRKMRCDVCVVVEQPLAGAIRIGPAPQITNRWIRRVLLHKVIPLLLSLSGIEVR